MASVKLSVELITKAPTIALLIKDRIADKMNNSVTLSIPNIRSMVADLLKDSIRNSPEVNELLDGNLRHQLGATKDEVEATVDFLIDRLIATMKIDFKAFKKFGGKFGGYLEVAIFPQTLIDELMAFPKASFLTKKGVKIPWMEWLLTLGDRIIVKKYDIDYLHTRGTRTGGASMKPTRVRGWRVPAGYSGTRTNNFITRALDNIENHVGYIMAAEIRRQI